MKVINLGIDEIKVYEQNPVIHSETQIENIMQSINEFGFKQPIVLDKEKVEQWIKNGAKPTDSVKALIEKAK